MFKMYVVYDSIVGSYLFPFVLKNRAEAVRAFTDVCNDENTKFCKYPSDYTLFEIGDFDSNSGNIILYEAKISLGLALDFIKREESIVKGV